MKRVVVTGASGFIGANLTRRLLREGHETHLFLRESHHAWRMREISGDVRIHQADIQDRSAVGRLVRDIRPDWVFNLAVYGAYSTQTDIDLMIATNITGCISLLEACAATGVEAFVQTGSSSEYGYKDHASREEELIQPNTHYAMTKAAATHCCQFIARKHHVNAVTLRLYSIYGPYEEPTRLIPTLIAYGALDQLPPLASPRTAHDFVYIDDVVEALLRVASTPETGRGAVYNVCSGVQHDLEAVVSCARRLMNIKAEPAWSQMPGRPWDTEDWVGSPSLMKEQMGWTSGIGFETGLQRTIDWFAGSPQWLRDLYSSRIFCGGSGGR